MAQLNEPKASCPRFPQGYEVPTDNQGLLAHVITKDRRIRISRARVIAITLRLVRAPQERADSLFRVKDCLAVQAGHQPNSEACPGILPEHACCGSADSSVRLYDRHFSLSLNSRDR